MQSDEMVETAFIAFVGADMSKVCTNHPTRYRLRAALTAVYPAIRAEVLREAMAQAELVENANITAANRCGPDAPGAMDAAAGAAAVKSCLHDLLALAQDQSR